MTAPTVAQTTSLTHARAVLVAMLRADADEATGVGERTYAARANAAAEVLESLDVNDRDLDVDWGVPDPT